VDSSYEYGRIKVLDQQLRAAGVPEPTIAEIMAADEGNAPAR